MRMRVGTCGWQYRSWRGVLYPADLPASRWLEHYATIFDTVECDAAFYRLPAKETFAKWAATVPAGFTMAVKASRFLTHVKRLADPAEPVARLLDAASGLLDRLGPILVQLPPSLAADLDRLDACLACFPPSVRVAVEPRHPSWWTAETQALLQRRGATLVWSDRLTIAQAPLWRTANFGYLRMHQGRADFPPDYHPQTLRKWLRRLHETWPADDEEVFVFFNNDPGGAAVRDAMRMRRLGFAETGSDGRGGEYGLLAKENGGHRSPRRGT